MMNEKTLSGQLLEEHHVVTIAELCRSCTVETETISLFVNEGILDPVGDNPMNESTGQWQFSITSLRRVKTAIHLQRDLGVNLAGAALALELLDRIAEMEGRQGPVGFDRL